MCPTEVYKYGTYNFSGTPCPFLNMKKLNLTPRTDIFVATHDRAHLDALFKKKIHFKTDLSRKFFFSMEISPLTFYNLLN